MNKSYLLYKDNDVIVEDENGNKRVIKYQDNIENLLIYENLVETLEKSILTLEKEIKTLKIIPETAKIQNLTFYGFGILTSITVPQVLVYLAGSNQLVETTLGTMNLSTLLTIPSTSSGVLLFGMAYKTMDSQYKHDLNHKNGLQTELLYLKKILEEEQKQLKELRINDTDSRTNLNEELKEIKVDDSKMTNALEIVKNLYYNCGYYDKKWFKLYRKGKLKTKLKKYKDYEIKLIEEHFEEKSKQLKK